MLGAIRRKLKEDKQDKNEVSVSSVALVENANELLRNIESSEAVQNIVDGKIENLKEIEGDEDENKNESDTQVAEKSPKVTFNKQQSSKSLNGKRDGFLSQFFKQWSEERSFQKRKNILTPKDKKLKKPKKIGNILLTDPRKYQTESVFSKILRVIFDTFYEFAGITKINGMYYLRRFVTHGFQRILWSCIMISLLSFAITLIYLLYRRYIDSPTRVTIAAPLSIHDIPFPGITICHPQNVMEYKSKEFVTTAKLPLGATPEDTVDILPLLAGFTERQWVVPREEDLEMIDSILVANNLTVKGAIDKLGTVCSDFLIVCVFAGQKFPCFQHHSFMKFKESYSYLGACCSFNYHPDTSGNVNFFKAKSFGIDGGLSVIGTGRPQASDGRSGAVSSEGFVLIVHHPNDFAVESAPTTYVELNRETFIDIQPIYSSCSEQVLGLPFEQRKCIIPSDKGKENYRQPECMLECLREEIHRRCKCHPFHLPRAPNQTHALKDCRAVDVMCFVDNYFQFKTAKCTHCYPSCEDVFYKTSSFKMNLNQMEHSVNEIYTFTNVTNQEFIVRIYFGGQRVTANKKIVVMSWISLLSNLGGSFSLCLGVSVLSLCEIVYFIFVRMIKHYKRIFQVSPVIPKFKNDQGKF